MKRPLAVPLLTLGVLVACQDATAPSRGPSTSRPSFDSRAIHTTWTVNSLADPGDGACTSDNCTLREAIAAAQDNDKVAFKSSLSGTITLTAGELVVARSIDIDGQGRFTVDANRASRVMTTSGATVSIEGLTITGGLADYGGGINNPGNLTLDNVSVVANKAGGGTGGGGIFNAGNLVVKNSQILGNESLTDGGGVWGAITATNTVISGNTATGAGGGLYLRNTVNQLVGASIRNNKAARGGGLFTEPFGTTTILRSTFATNQVSEGSGQAIVNDGVMAIRSSTIVDNFSENPFAAGVWSGGTLTVANTIIAGNHVPDPRFGGTIWADCTRFDIGKITSLGYNLTISCFAASATDLVIQPVQLFTEVLGAATGSGINVGYPPLERGRAVDAGYCPGETVDQFGGARPYDDTRIGNAADGCDIGALEWRPPVAPKPKK